MRRHHGVVYNLVGIPPQRCNASSDLGMLLTPPPVDNLWSCVVRRPASRNSGRPQMPKHRYYCQYSFRYPLESFRSHWASDCLLAYQSCTPSYFATTGSSDITQLRARSPHIRLYPNPALRNPFLLHQGKPGNHLIHTRSQCSPMRS